MEDKKDKLASWFALEEAQKAFEGFAEENTLEDVDYIVKMVKDIRKKIKYCRLSVAQYIKIIEKEKNNTCGGLGPLF